MAERESGMNVIRHPSTYTPPALAGGSEPPHDGGMEARVARLESAVEHIQGDIRDIKADLRDLRGEIRDLRSALAALRDSTARWRLRS